MIWQTVVQEITLSIPQREYIFHNNKAKFDEWIPYCIVDWTLS